MYFVKTTKRYFISGISSSSMLFLSEDLLINFLKSYLCDDDTAKINYYRTYGQFKYDYSRVANPDEINIIY